MKKHILAFILFLTPFMSMASIIAGSGVDIKCLTEKNTLISLN